MTSVALRQRTSGDRVNSGSTPVRVALLMRKCACGGPAGLTGQCAQCESERLRGDSLQTKLRINEPGDQYEQEADRVADEVMRIKDARGGAYPSRFNVPPLIQRSIGGNGRERTSVTTPIVQRQEGSLGQPSREGVEATPSEEPQEEGSRCPTWFGDPESISKRAAETYVQNDMTPPSNATVERIDCEPPVATGNYGCHVHFSDGLVIRVIVRKQDIVVGTAPINTLHPPPATPLCFYDYECPDGQLVLSKRECKSSAPSGPTRIVQRSANHAAARMPTASLVDEVLSSPGQPLEAPTRDFFMTRFGHDFGRVRLHTDARAAESARAVNALAYTVGHDVVFASGEYAPNTLTGRRLLAHELTHVVQQAGEGSATRSGRNASMAKSPVLQRSAKFSKGSVSEEFNLAERFLAGKGAGDTDFVLNGAAFTNVDAGLKAFHAPEIATSTEAKHVNCSFQSVPDNEVSFAMKILKAGTWSAATTKARMGELFPTLAGCAGDAAATFVVKGMPTNDSQRKRTRTHEDQHVKDYKAILNDVIVPWDKRITEAHAQKLKIPGTDKDDCTSKLYRAAAGQKQTPAHIVAAIIKQINEKGAAFHATAAGRDVNISEPKTGKDCARVSAEAR